MNFFSVEEKFGSNFGLVLTAEKWCWAGLGQWLWAVFFSKLSSKEFLTKPKLQILQKNFTFWQILEPICTPLGTCTSKLAASWHCLVRWRAARVTQTTCIGTATRMSSIIHPTSKSRTQSPQMSNPLCQNCQWRTSRGLTQEITLVRHQMQDQRAFWSTLLTVIFHIWISRHFSLILYENDFLAIFQDFWNVYFRGHNYAKN